LDALVRQLGWRLTVIQRTKQFNLDSARTGTHADLFR
jgi:hypothetical protein